MANKIYCEDAYCLGLLYTYMNTGISMVPYDNLIMYGDIVNKNIEDIEKNNVSLPLWTGEEEKIYSVVGDIDGNMYFSLLPDFDLDKAVSMHMGCLSSDALVASQMDNALSVLGLQKVDGKIVKKENDKDESIDYIGELIKALKDKRVRLITESQEFSEERIVAELERYQKLVDACKLNSNISKDLIKRNNK